MKHRLNYVQLPFLFVGGVGVDVPRPFSKQSRLLPSNCAALYQIECAEIADVRSSLNPDDMEKQSNAPAIPETSKSLQQEGGRCALASSLGMSCYLFLTASVSPHCIGFFSLGRSNLVDPAECQESQIGLSWLKVVHTPICISTYTNLYHDTAPICFAMLLQKY